MCVQKFLIVEVQIMFAVHFRNNSIGVPIHKVIRRHFKAISGPLCQVIAAVVKSRNVENCFETRFEECR